MSAVKSSSQAAGLGNSSMINKDPLSESDILNMDTKEIRPEHVLRLNQITEGYLCSPKDNIYNIDFTRFKIRDMETKEVLFEIAKPPGQTLEIDEKKDPNVGRFVRCGSNIPSSFRQSFSI